MSTKNCILTIQHNGTIGQMDVLVPRPDGPRLLSIGPGERADIDVTQMVWPPPPAPPDPRPRAEWLSLLVVMAPSALLAALAAQSELHGMGLVVVALSTVGWLAAAVDVWKAARR